MSKISRLLFRAGTAGHVGLYRATGGRAGSMGGKVLLLTTKGRRTGKRRTTPLMFVEEGGALVVAATAGGSARHPGWYHNLVTFPDVEVQVGSDRSARRARIARSGERDDLYRMFVALSDGFAKYEQRTDRTIPVVVLEPPGWG